MEDFTKGYLCAVSSLVAGHGRDTEAEDLLKCIGRVKWREMEPYDREVFRKAGMRKFFDP